VERVELKTVYAEEMMSTRQKRLVTDSLQEAQGEDVAIEDILEREECPPSLLDCELYQTPPLSPNMECTRPKKMRRL
jgi:hypothetical protein